MDRVKRKYQKKIKTSKPSIYKKTNTRLPEVHRHEVNVPHLTEEMIKSLFTTNRYRLGKPGFFRDDYIRVLIAYEAHDHLSEDIMEGAVAFLPYDDLIYGGMKAFYEFRNRCPEEIWKVDTPPIPREVKYVDVPPGVRTCKHKVPLRDKCPLCVPH